VATPTSADLAALLGRTVTQEQGDAVISVVSAMASAHTRGVGFADSEPNAEIRAVILAASARMISNPAGIRTETVGPESVSYSPFIGFTVGELVVLDRYRVKAM
jgi:hypothetical protein